MLMLPVLVAACATPPNHALVPPPQQDLLRPLPAGAIVRLQPAEGGEASTAAVDGWWREALRQSDWLDIAAGPVATSDTLGTNTVTVQLAVDAARDVAVATAVEAAGPFVLASVPTAGRPLHHALDELALRVRIALGDPVAQPALPIARIYAADAELTAACEGALADVRIGSFAAAARRLEAVRRRDGASAFLLETMASTASMLGDAATARRLAEEALRFENRRGPTTTHRLLRTLLLARGALEPALAGRYDLELANLAEVAGRERPHDPEVQFTAAMAANFLGRFAVAEPQLERLEQRLPGNAGVTYHLGWAALGNGHAEAASRAFDRVAAALPIRATLVPRALARWSAGEHRELRALLAAAAAEPAVRDGTALHEVRRMQAALELLVDDPAAAADHMLADLHWLVAHAELLELRAGEFADTAHVLVRLGHGERLRPLLQSVVASWPDTMVADAAMFATGLVEAAAGRRRANAVETALHRRGRVFWGDSLTAFGQRQVGELSAEQEALANAARHSSSPLLKAALVENLRALGRTAEAATLAAAVRRELAVVDLRRKSQSPLLGPELAFAWLVCSNGVNR